MVQDTSIEALRKKEGRGKVLTAILVLESIFVIYTLMSAFSANNFFLIFPITKALILVGLWQWRRMAIYTFFVYLIFSILTTFIAITEIHLISPPSAIGEELGFRGMANLIEFGASLFLYFWIFKRKWHLFR